MSKDIISLADLIPGGSLSSDQAASLGTLTTYPTHYSTSDRSLAVRVLGEAIQAVLALPAPRSRNVVGAILFNDAVALALTKVEAGGTLRPAHGFSPSVEFFYLVSAMRATFLQD